MHEPHDYGESAEDAPIAELIARACVVVPEQGPLPAFVHHNTLHHFEHLPFHQGVVEGARLLGSQPFQAETAFARHLANDRISNRDIDAVLDAESGPLDEALFPSGPTRRAFRAFRLRHALDLPSGQALEWCLHEEGQAFNDWYPATSLTRKAELTRVALTLFSGPRATSKLLRRVWDTLDAATPKIAVVPPTSPRPRDQLWLSHGVDTDLAVHSLLIRFTASFLDQGVAYWEMPGRGEGMLGCFRALYSQGGGPPDTAFHGLRAELDRQQREAWGATQTITWALEELGVPRTHWFKVIQLTLQSLRGWAGMVRQFELRPDWAPVKAPPTRLDEYLAIHLLLDCVTAKNVIASHPEPSIPSLNGNLARDPVTYEAFVLAQLSDIDPAVLLIASNAQHWLDEIRRFNDLERRRLWHLAYERRYRIQVLDALKAHIQDPHPTPQRATYQAVFCIDDREESLRRHLETILPDVQSFGCAGFFGVAMEYQGIHDVRPRALCPVVVTPKHLVREVAVDPGAQVFKAKDRSKRGKREHAWTVGTRTLLRGSVLSAAFGLTALVPLIGRSLFPRASRRWSQHRPTDTHTRLAIERAPDAQLANGLMIGYSVGEMADIVVNTLETLGICTNLSPLVLIVGHGSSSVNNPHRAAYDCGATGGGKGGPNARAFAAMANHRSVRAELAMRGKAIPDDTHFVGAYHDTSEDSMTYYDTDLIPHAAKVRFQKLQATLRQACELDAHERCRRFMHAPLDLTPQEALCHVEGRAADIGQPRPECGHATNAICLIGRRERTRGLFLDRRAFLVTYDPTSDPTEEILGNIMQAVGPVGAGINLEYYFSYVDPKNYGCGSKLPHNLVGLFAVMDGHASDLRTGLPWQMVEIHEPVRMLTIVEAKPETLIRVLERRPSVAPLVLNEWILLVAMDPDSSDLFVFENGRFRSYTPETLNIPTFESSVAVYKGNRDHLPCVRLQKPNLREARG